MRCGMVSGFPFKECTGDTSCMSCIAKMCGSEKEGDEDPQHALSSMREKLVPARTRN